MGTDAGFQEFLNPQKLLIFFLDMKVRDYESFRMRANSILDAPLPESTRLRRYGHISGFIGFAKGWKPSFFALRGPGFRGAFKRRCKYALKPVFESFGLEWQAPPVSRQVLAILFVLLIVFWPQLWISHPSAIVEIVTLSASAPLIATIGRDEAEAVRIVEEFRFAILASHRETFP